MNPPGLPAEALVNRLTGDRYDGYLRQPIPSDTDEDVRAAVQAYIQGDLPARNALLELVSEESATVIEIFGEREAVVAVRTGSLEPTAGSDCRRHRFSARGLSGNAHGLEQT